VVYHRGKRAPRTWLIRAAVTASVLGIIVITVLLGMHALPGFNNYRVAQDVVLTPGAAPYSLYLNFDKTVAGILLLGIVYRALMRKGNDWALALQRAAPLLVLNIVVLVLLALPLGYLTFDPKTHSLFWIWAPVNLFFTCVTEEAFFRGFIQRELASAVARSAWRCRSWRTSLSTQRTSCSSLIHTQLECSQLPFARQKLLNFQSHFRRAVECRAHLAATEVIEREIISLRR
jgi:membrane protease YdiL (CAAX protease family)